MEKCLAGRDTDLMFTKQGVPIQTKLFKDLSQTDQMAVIHGEAISLSQKEMEAVCTLAHLKHKSNTPNMDLIPVPEGIWPKTGHQSRYLRDTLHQPFRQVGIGTLPRTFLPKSCTLIRDPIPIVIKEGILFPANKKCWLDSLLTIPTTYCRDPGIQIYLQPTRTWAERYTKGEASLTITKARLHQSPLHLQERRAFWSGTVCDTRELLICISNTHPVPTVIPPTIHDKTGPIGFLCFISGPENPSLSMRIVDPSRCWGCGTIPAYANNCFHKFKYCPYKSDRQVVANFKDKTRKMTVNSINNVNVYPLLSSSKTTPLIPTTTNLPHIPLPISDESGSIKTIQGLLDTGSYFNLGTVSYWKQFHLNFPQHVQSMQQLPSMCEADWPSGPVLTDKPLHVTHYIDLRTPFVQNNKRIIVRLSLVQENIPHLVLGLPFILKSQLSIFLAERRAFSPVFNTTFLLEYHTTSNEMNGALKTITLGKSTDRTISRLLQEHACPTQMLSTTYKKLLPIPSVTSPIQCRIWQAYRTGQQTLPRITYNTFLDTQHFLAQASVHAASAATKTELEQAQKLRELTHTKPVKTERKIWRPQVTSRYREPDCIPDPSSDMEILYKDFGKPLWAKKSKLAPRDDIIQFSKEKHQAEFDRNIQWRECLPKYQKQILPLLLEYWDVFAEEGVRKHIRGVSFHVDTGEATPICTKSPRYGPHESRVINELVEKLEKNGLVEDDDGPWGALIVLAAKANQEHVHWSQYIWRLCVSYRKLNAMTRPFTFPIIRCDDAVKAIGDRRYYITMDLDSGYWQIEAEPSSRAKLAFFTPTGKKRWTVMPMGATNAHPVFVALVTKFKAEWDAKAKRRGLKRCISQVIVDDIILAAHDPTTLIEYFKCVLEVLQHYRVTAKLRKCRFFVPIAEFVGLDVHPDGNSPAASKSKAFRDLTRPNTFTDLNMLIGCFGFYQEHLPLFEVKMDRWRQIQKLRPPKGTALEEDAKILKKEWKDEDDQLLEELKDAILSFPILRRPNPELRFYLKTDWSKNAMGAALLQPDQDDQRALEAMHNEKTGEKCMFDLTKSGIRLYPLAFISRRTSDPEKSYHSYVGEACTGVWAIEKFRHYLFGREFTWLTDCSGVKKFFEGNDVPTHMIQRWRMQLLRYDFTIVHRPGRMMFECDMLSRYNQATEAWRENRQHDESDDDEQDDDDQDDTIPVSFAKVQFTGHIKQFVAKTATKYDDDIEDDSIDDEQERLRLQELTDKLDDGISVWMWGPSIMVLNRALQDLGLELFNSAIIGPYDFEEPSDTTHHHYYTWEEAHLISNETEISPHWFVITRSMTNEEWDTVQTASQLLARKGLQAIVIVSTKKLDQNMLLNWTRNLEWYQTTFQMQDALLGGGSEMCCTVTIISYQVQDKTLEEIQLHSDIKYPTQERCESILDNIENGSNDHEQYIQPLNERAQSNLATFPHKAKTISYVQINDSLWIPVFDPNNPLPDLRSKDRTLPTGEPVVEIQDALLGRVLRPLKWTEVARIIGLRDDDIQDIITMCPDQQSLWQFLSNGIPKGILKSLATILHLANNMYEDNKNKKKLSDRRRYMSEAMTTLVCASNTNTTIEPELTTRITRWTTIPLPSHKKWVDATADDPNLSLIVEAIVEHTQLDRHQLQNKMYYTPFEKGLFEVDDGILYYAKEPATMNIRQLRRRVVPKELQHVIIIAFHSTPLAGHVGLYKTFWRIAARYWWPTYYKDIREAVQGCAHCVLTNATGHKSQQIWKALEFDVPFDVISMDIWSPGEVQTKFGETKVLTSLDTMTGFASADFLRAGVDSEQLARRAYAAFFVPNGLPKLILIDAGSENKGVFINMCTTLGIRYHMVSPDEHNGILCERFHRYLNKVEKIHAADTQSHTQWAQGTLFATYAWNASPIDGTNIIRSFAAKARVFPFPIEISESATTHIPPGEGEMAINHLETIFPLWAKQNMLLQILQEQRRERHRALKNEGLIQRKFEVGDLVIVQKQVKSKTVNEVALPAKQQISKYKGPYKVIEKLGTKSYKVQRIPTVQGTRKPGKLLKFSASNMTKIPSTLVIHKKLDTQDTRLAALERPLVHNPLEQALGFHQYGKYVRTPSDTEFAYDRIEDMWQDEVDDDSDCSNEDSSDEEPDISHQIEKDTQNISSDHSEGDNQDVSPIEDEQEQDSQVSTRSMTKRRKQIHTQLPNKKGRTESVPVYETMPLIVSKQELYDATKESKDKMFIIWDATTKLWFVVKVIWNRTIPTKAMNEGTYFLQWYMRHHLDAKTHMIKNCRFWPLLKKFDGKGGFIDELRFVNPHKLDDTLKKWKKQGQQQYGLFHQPWNLHRTRLIGPFDLESRTVNTKTNTHYVPEGVWKKLQEVATQRNLDVTNVTKIQPHKIYVRNSSTVNTS
jgi:hypothetical protein